MTDIPSAVGYLTVTLNGEYAIADSTDAGSQPDGLPLNGTLLIKPQGLQQPYVVDTADKHLIVVGTITASIVNGQVFGPPNGYSPTGGSPSGPLTLVAPLQSAIVPGLVAGSIPPKATWSWVAVFQPANGEKWSSFTVPFTGAPGDTVALADAALTQVTLGTADPSLIVNQIQTAVATAQQAASDSADSAAAAESKASALSGDVDTAMTTVANDPTSDFVAALNGAIAGQRPLPTVADVLAKPTWRLLHGGNNLMAPDNTTELSADQFAFAPDMLDFDVWPFGGTGTDLAISHDATVDFMTTASGKIGNLTPGAFRVLTVDSSAWFHQGWQDTHAHTVEDVLRAYGNKVVLHFELKYDSAGMAGDSGAALLGMIQRHNIEKSVIVSSSQYAWLLPFAAAGIECMVEANQNNAGTFDPAQMLSDGIRSISIIGNSYTNFPTTGGTGGATDAQFQTFITAGINVVMATTGRQFEAAHYTSLGCKGVWATSPYVWGDPSLYRRTTDPLEANRQYHAPFLTCVPNNGVKDDTYSDDMRGIFGNGRHKLAVASDIYVLQAWACPLVNAAASYTIDLDFIIDQPHADATKHIGLRFGCPDDKPMLGTSADESYQATLRYNGQMQLYRSHAGVSGTQLAALTTGTVPMLTTAPLLSAGLTAGAAITALPVTAGSVPNAIPAGTKLYLPTTGGAGGKGQAITVSSAVAAGATSIPINSVTPTTAVASGAAVPQLIHCTLAVTPTSVTFTRTDTSQSISANDSTLRGGFFHVYKYNGGSGASTISYQNVAIS